MLSNITIGRYYAVESKVHALDPRLKILSTFAYLILLFVIDSVWSLFFCAFLLCLAIKLSKVPFKFVLKGVRPILFIVFLTALLNLFMTDGRPIAQFYFLKITHEGILRSIFMASRLVFLIMSSSLMTFTTTELALTDGIESLLKPFKIVKVPAHEIAMMMSIALRFIPTLIDETDKIMKAQMARGASFDSKNIVKKAKSFLPLLIPIFISSFKRAEDLALAMEARCYRGGEGRTRLNKLKYSQNDLIAAGIVVSAMLLALLLDRLLFSNYWGVV